MEHWQGDNLHSGESTTHSLLLAGKGAWARRTARALVADAGVTAQRGETCIFSAAAAARPSRCAEAAF